MVQIAGNIYKQILYIDNEHIVYTTVQAAGRSPLFL